MKMVKKISLGSIFIIISFYLVLIIDTNIVMNRAKKIFLNNTSENEINDQLFRYDSCRYFKKEEIGKIELKLFRVFVFHNFQKGIMVIYYTHFIYDNHGNILMGSKNIFPVIWRIKKFNKIWNVIEIKEDP